MNRVIRKFSCISCAILGVAATGLIISSSTSALTEESEVDVRFTFNPMLTLSVSSADIIIPNLIPGTSDNSNTVAVTVNTNNISGYSLSATVGNTTNSSRNLVHTALNTNLFSSIDTSSNITSFTTDNTWGYSIDDGAHYSGLPIYTDTPKEIKKTTEAGNSYTNFLIGAKASSTQISGDYTNVINFTVVANPEPTEALPGKIVYVANASGVAGEMGDQTSTNNTEVVLYAPNFKRQGFGFAGWNTKRDGSGTNYGPNETITTDSNFESEGLALYAMWVPSAGTMQSWTGCSSLQSGTVTALTDNRDGDVYAVAKLADGKCWMIENLRLDDSVTLSTSNTHSPLLPLTNTDGTTSNHLSPTTDPYQTAWCETNSAACDDQSMTATNNTTMFINNTSSNYAISGTNGNVYSYGNYYNWYSATAGNGKYSVRSGNVAGDICPAGWHLPTGEDASREFGLLDKALGGNGVTSTPSTTPTGATMSLAYRSYPNNFIYSGNVSGSLVSGRSSGGFYWSSTAYNSNYANYFGFGSSNVLPGTGGVNKYDGRTVRCVAGS